MELLRSTTVAHAFEGMEQPQRDHFTGPEVRLRMFGDGVHVAAEKASILRVKVPSCQLPDSGT